MPVRLLIRETKVIEQYNAAFTRNAFSNTFRIKRFSLKRFRKRLRSHGISETFSKRFENVLRSHGFNANNGFYIWKLISIFFFI